MTPAFKQNINFLDKVPGQLLEEEGRYQVPPLPHTDERLKIGSERWGGGGGRFTWRLCPCRQVCRRGGRRGCMARSPGRAPSPSAPPPLSPCCRRTAASTRTLIKITISIADPDPDPKDPYVFGPPGSDSGSKSQRYGSNLIKTN
jgi:hypothetical protein